MRTNYYKAKKQIKVNNEIIIKRGGEVLGSPHSKGKVMLFTKYWFEYPAKDLKFISNFTKE
jgi:hypothetical protein